MTGTIQAHTFRPRDLVGGHVVVDLLNTVTARGPEPIDWLDGYPRLLEWAALTGRFDPAVLARLARAAEAEPRAAAQALDRARDLREALHDVVTALLAHDDAPPPAGALERVERHWKHAAARARLTVHGDTARLAAAAEASGLDYLADELALQALDLLRDLPHERTRVCPGPRCGWLFIDTSRGGRRRWCDMGTCGNATKGKAHYQRKRQAESGERGGGADAPSL
ncbi:CGNR zinc finger domain-containing protein [Yinghuangia seranimata]|uniref:CGNR zinc finger domain-containing protein n=1 Tax=Yinghuangia seranimata TaxID=408067 RepID=UPI00248B9D1C|nr:CGNR zinc finger domain-containing protein [Yinghuangia seranimata]MDI2129115.1 CGNR zinc finger domain-containing protein [Yinghuangia seranimata]